MCEQVKQVFYNFVNGFAMMKRIPIMWHVMKMCIIVFVTVATTFIIALAIQGYAHTFWLDIGEKVLVMKFTSWYVSYIGSVIAFIILIYYAVRIAIIFKRNRQLKSTK